MIVFCILVNRKSFVLWGGINLSLLWALTAVIVVWGQAVCRVNRSLSLSHSLSYRHIDSLFPTRVCMQEWVKMTYPAGDVLTLHIHKLKPAACHVEHISQNGAPTQNKYSNFRTKMALKDLKRVLIVKAYHIKVPYSFCVSLCLRCLPGEHLKPLNCRTEWNKECVYVWCFVFSLCST